MDTFFTTKRSNRPFRMLVTSVALLALTSVACGGGSVTLNPANSIQAAINSGQYSEIVLEPGTYNQTIVIESGDAPLTLRCQDPSNQNTVDATILDGEFLGTSVVLLTSGVGADVVIDGLTIRNGEAFGGAGPANRGGAIDCEAASPTIRRCVFVDNQADSVGGAVYVNAGDMTIDDCTFRNNDADHGGAVYGNNSTLQFNRCIFQLNSATVEGGAVRAYSGSYAFDQCAFDNSFAGTYGGAIAIRNGAMFSATRCSFKSNSCGDGQPDNGRGGAIMHDGSDNAFVENCLFINNACALYGGSVYSFQTITLRNTTHYLDNDGAGAGAVVSLPAGGTLHMHNCIAWAYGGSAPLGNVGAHDVTYCNIQGGYTGAGNIDVDPQFTNVGSNDLHLLATSPCIDAGDATKIVGQYPVDYDGLPRALDDPDTPDTGVAVVGISVDMGAFEFQPPGGPADACPADLNDDLVIDVFDLFDLLAAWGACD